MEGVWHAETLADCKLDSDMTARRGRHWPVSLEYDGDHVRESIE